MRHQAPHRLTEADRGKRTATCSVCGPLVEIVLKGKAGIACREGDRQAKRRYRLAHPERVRQQKNRPPSKHRLSKRDGSPDTCAVCGPVSPVVIGRGFGCPNRAAELGWKKFATKPAVRCSCGTYLSSDGKCLTCDTRENTDLGYAIKVSEWESKRAHERMRWIFDQDDDYFSQDGEEDSPWGYHQGETPLNNGYESAVPGWKTLGSAEFRDGMWHEVRPDYAKLYGSGGQR